MKNRKCIFWGILTAVTFSCSNNDKVNSGVSDSCNNEKIIKREYIYEEFEVFTPNSILDSMLDKIVKTSTDCRVLPGYNLIYCLSAYQNNDSLSRLSIELREQKRIYCQEIDGLFVYKNALFGIKKGSLLNEYFIPTGKKVKLNCQKANSLMFDYHEDKDGYWDFVFYHGRFICISYGICGKSWRNEQYYYRDSVMQH